MKCESCGTKMESTQSIPGVKRYTCNCGHEVFLTENGEEVVSEQQEDGYKTRENS